jgi:cytochrome-b5 reductase
MKEPFRFLGIPMPFGSRRKVHEKPFPTEEERARWRRKQLIVEIAMLAFALSCVDLIRKSFQDIPVFDAPKFTFFSIINKEDVSPTSFIVTVRPKSFVDNPKLAKTDPYAKEWEKGTWSVEFKQPQLQIARSYTPLPPREVDNPGDLRFLIREEANGEMSRYLGQLRVGDKVELRGPHMEVELPAKVTDILFLAGGTGIAPALQVAYTLLEVRKPSEELPNIHIIWSNRRREDCVGGTSLQPGTTTDRAEGTIVQELQKLQEKHPDNVRVEYFVDEEGTSLDSKMITQLTRRPSHLKHQAVSTRINTKLLFVSGPEGFINFLAGPKKYWDGKQLQGELGGLIGQIGIKDWEVWKQ